METIYKAIIDALNDTYDDIAPNYYKYDGSEALLDAYLEDATNRVKDLFKTLGVTV